MNYWLCVTNEENWKVIKERKVWGVSKRNKRSIERVKPGDLLVFYVMPQRIMGIFKATSEPFESTEGIFSWGEFGREEVFPHRVKLEPVVIAEEPIYFKDLIPRLRFIRNKKMWTGYLRRAMRTIPREDYNLIYTAISRGG
ncbi:MAG: EVE domain-containing protein [Nitrososphaerota archaeon]